MPPFHLPPRRLVELALQGVVTRAWPESVGRTGRAIFVWSNPPPECG